MYDVYIEASECLCIG